MNACIRRWRLVFGLALLTLLLAVPDALAVADRSTGPAGERPSVGAVRGDEGDDDDDEDGTSRRAVYIQTNTAPDNFVQVYFRRDDGRLTVGPLVKTGGSGSPASPPFGFPIVDSQGSVTLSHNGRLLFVVNTGSNTVSSFLVTGKGLELADQEATRGAFPTSVTVSKRGPGHNLLYVLNEVSRNVSGYTVNGRGEMTPISDGVRAVSGAFSAQVGFDTGSKVLTVTNRGTNTISTYTVGSNGRLGPEVVTPGQGGFPFGFDYTKRGHLIIATSVIPLTPIYPGLGASYDVNTTTGAVTPIDLEPSNGLDTCWVEMSKDDKYAFMTNGASSDISRFSVGSDGQLKLLGLTATPGEAALDEDKSRDGRFLYVLNTDVALSPAGFPIFGASRVTAYAIRSNGDLTMLGSAPDLPYNGASGTAAW